MVTRSGRIGSIEIRQAISMTGSLEGQMAGRPMIMIVGAGRGFTSTAAASSGEAKRSQEYANAEVAFISFLFLDVGWVDFTTPLAPNLQEEEGGPGD
jgi:hypothetical protein